MAGARGSDLLSLAGLPEEAARTARCTAPTERLESLLALAAERTGSHSFALDLADAVPRGTFTWMEFALRSADTLNDALETLARYSAILDRANVFAVAHSAGGAALEYVCSERSQGLGPHLNEFVAAYALRLGCEIVGQSWRPEDVWFAHRDEVRRAALAQRFGRSPRFGAGSTGMLIPRALLGRTLHGADVALCAWLRGQMHGLCQRRSVRPAVADLVRAEAARRLGDGTLSVASIASALGMSQRTLQRSLRDEGASFSGVVLELRRTLAIAYLRRGDLTVGRIGMSLGYSHPRAFERAFRLWTGAAPSEWRCQRDEARTG